MFYNMHYSISVVERYFKKLYPDGKTHVVNNFVDRLYKPGYLRTTVLSNPGRFMQLLLFDER